MMLFWLPSPEQLGFLTGTIVGGSEHMIQRLTSISEACGLFQRRGVNLGSPGATLRTVSRFRLFTCRESSASPAFSVPLYGLWICRFYSSFVRSKRQMVEAWFFIEITVVLLVVNIRAKEVVVVVIPLVDEPLVTKSRGFHVKDFAFCLRVCCSIVVLSSSHRKVFRSTAPALLQKSVGFFWLGGLSKVGSSESEKA